jgi:hypothetical protein
VGLRKVDNDDDRRHTMADDIPPTRRFSKHELDGIGPQPLMLAIIVELSLWSDDGPPNAVMV